MHETATTGELVKIWLSPFAQLVFDVAFAFIFLGLVRGLGGIVRRLRKGRAAS